MLGGRAKLSAAVRVREKRKNVWEEFGQLAETYKPVNLGLGFPDFDPPRHVTKALSEAALSDNYRLNQYTRGSGHPNLAHSVANLYSKLNEKEIDHLTEVLVTAGASEAIYCAILAFVNPGDEVIVIEPFFDCYGPMIEIAGGIPVFVPLRPKYDEHDGCLSSDQWTFDCKELESKFNRKTKMIVVNTPHNPTGKVFTRTELEKVGALCVKYDCIALMDEVYEWMVFGDKQHIRMAKLPSMWNRTITVGSGSKSFSVTGWKLGWAYGPASLIQPMQRVHQNCVGSCPIPIQEALATCINVEISQVGENSSYWKQLSVQLEKKRDFLCTFLQKVDIQPVVPDSGYFMLVECSKATSKVDFNCEQGPSKDYRFAKWLCKNKKLLGIPPSAFCSSQNAYIVEDYLRFCFAKSDQTLEEAVVRFATLT